MCVKLLARLQRVLYYYIISIILYSVHCSVFIYVYVYTVYLRKQYNYTRGFCHARCPVFVLYCIIILLYFTRNLLLFFLRIYFRLCKHNKMYYCYYYYFCLRESTDTTTYELWESLIQTRSARHVSLRILLYWIPANNTEFKYQ
jgi:hypothetical protein